MFFIDVGCYTIYLSPVGSKVGKKSEEFLIGCSQAMASAANAHCKTVFFATKKLSFDCLLKAKSDDSFLYFIATNSY